VDVWGLILQGAGFQATRVRMKSDHRKAEKQVYGDARGLRGSWTYYRRHTPRLWLPTATWLAIVGIGAPIAWLLGLMVMTASPTTLDEPLALTEYATALLSHHSFLIWAPFVLQAMLCLTYFLGSPSTTADSFLARMSIYTGFALASYHWLLLAFVLFLHEPVLAMIVLFAVPLPFGMFLWAIVAGMYSLPGRWLSRFARIGRLVLYAMTVLLFALPFLLLSMVLAKLQGDPLSILFGVSSLLVAITFFPLAMFLTCLLVCLPTLALIAYGGVSIYHLRRAWIDSNGQFSLGRIFVVTAWIAMLLSLWRITVMWTFAG